MNKPYLLTYQNEKGTTFSWFDTEEEMDTFIENNPIHVLEGIHIVLAEVIRQ